MNRILFSSTCVIALLAALAGCEDPTKGKPAAVVNEGSAPAQQEAAPTTGGTATLAFTENTKVGFVGSKVTGSHDGGFNSLSGGITLPGDDLTAAAIEVTIDMNSTWSDNERLTGHLKSADFFDVENHPESSFKSTAITKTDTGYNISGDLTLHGVTKNITFPATMSLENGVLKAQSEFSVKRADFGIVYPGKPDDLIRDDVLIKLDIEAAPAE